MNKILLIAFNDLRLFLKDKGSYFWIFGAPLLFAFFMGLNRGPGSPSNPRPALLLDNRDNGFASQALLDELGAQGLRIVKPEENPSVQRGLRIPTNFTANILAKKPVKVEFYQVKDSPADAATMLEMRLARALIALNSHLLEQSGTSREPTESGLRELMQRTDPVTLDATFGSRKAVPAGFNQSIPGVLVMFVLMNLLIFGGTTIAEERREGVIRRMLANPVSRVQLVYGKILGLLGLGLVQILYLLGAAMLLMKFRLGTGFFPVLAILMIYGWAAGSLGVLLGSIIGREDKIVGVCVLATMVFAALGGCWWPLEVVPERVRMVGHISPAAWSMDALHQIISFGGSWGDITIPLLVLAGFAAIANLLAIRFFRP